MSELSVAEDRRVYTPEQARAEALELIAARPEIAGLQAYEYFRSNSGAIREEFINADEGEPVFDYSALNFDELRALELSMREVAELLLIAQDPKLRALLDAIEYRMSELSMLAMAAEMNNPNLDSVTRVEAAEYFEMANTSLYGRPNPAIFAAFAQKHLYRVLDTQTDNPAVAMMQDDLEKLVGNDGRTGAEYFEPTPELRKRFNDMVHERFDNLVDHVADGDYDYLAVAKAVEVALQKIGADQLGWRIEFIDGATNLSVVAHRKVVQVGTLRPESDQDDLKAAIVHEVGVHVQRSINADKAGWVSAAYGQDAYLDFEEALGSLAGSVYRSSNDARKKELQYLVAGLAMGQDGHEPRAFRQTYEIMWRISQLEKLLGTSKDKADAKKNSFNRVLRFFRGTPANLPGLLYLKDLSYVHGEEAVWKAFSVVETQADFDIFFAGKLDPTIADHLAIGQDIVEYLASNQ